MFPQAVPRFTIDEAYDLQFLVAGIRETRGERVAGYKVGCISPTMQRQLGLDRPVFGHVWESEIHPTGVVLDPGRFARLAIEGELAVRMAADVPSVEWLIRNRARAIASAFIVIELHNYLFRGDASEAAVELIANNAIHAGVVLPMEETGVKDPELLLDEPVRVVRNGALLGEGHGRDLEEGPWGSVVRLAEHLARRGRILRQGHLVLTGSPLPLWPVEAGDRIEVSCAAFGKIASMAVAG